MPPERFELPTPWVVSRCSDPLSYGGASLGRAPGARCVETPSALRRPTSPCVTRPAGLEPAPFRSTAGCSFRLSYNPSVIRRRRETATGACRVVGVAFQTTRAPCRNGRRRITVLLILLPFPRPSLVNQRAAREAPVLRLAVAPGVKCKTPHLALGAGGASVLLPGPGGCLTAFAFPSRSLRSNSSSAAAQCARRRRRDRWPRPNSRRTGGRRQTVRYAVGGWSMAS